MLIPLPIRLLMALLTTSSLCYAQQIFWEKFNLNPAAPQSFYGTPNYAIFIHSRDVQTQYQPYPSVADHGPNCEPPFLNNPEDNYEISHPVTAYDQVIFSCKNHLMTNLRADGYGLINIMPNQLVDLSQGEAVVTIDVSSFDQSAQGRDWWTITLMPLASFNPLHAPDWAPDLEGYAPNALWIHTRLFNGKRYFEIEMTDNERKLIKFPAAFKSLEELVKPSKGTRDTYELRISNNSIRLGMKLREDHPLGQAYFWWVDTETDAEGNPVNIPWNKAAVMMGHYVYNSRKGGNGMENTWHWDNLYIAPAIPMSISVPDARFADSDDPTLSFDLPAPPNAFLLFAAPDIQRVSNSIEVSFDEGNNWNKAQRITGSTTDVTDPWGVSYGSFKITIPEGTQEVRFRGQDGDIQRWMARDVYIFSESVETPEEPTPSPRLEAKLFLESMYNFELGYMESKLAENQLLPSSQPFDQAPFLYEGDEFLDQYSEDVIDWVLVELRAASDINQVIYQRAALLNKEGEILDMDGTKGISLVSSPAQEVYISISHKSSLSVLSNAPIKLTDTPTRYDFTTSSEQAKGTEQLKPLGDIFALYSGDFDGNGIINNQDFNLWQKNAASLNLYLSVDADGNAVVNNRDYNYWQRNRSKIGELLR